MIETIVALSHDKQRQVFGVVGIEINEEKIANVRLAKIWKRDDMNKIAPDMKALNDKIKWDMTFADQLVGQHLIRSIEKSLQFQVQTITTQKNLKNPEDIELIKVMDITEISQLTLSLKQENRIQFPKENATKDMEDLMNEVQMFTEHVTESGTVAYYAPGEEHDCLTRALMICLFAGRTQLQNNLTRDIIKAGIAKKENAEQSFDRFFKETLGNDYADLSQAALNRTDKNKLYAPKRFF